MKIIFTYPIIHPEAIGNVDFVEINQMEFWNEGEIIQIILGIHPNFIVCKCSKLVEKLIELQTEGLVHQDIEIILLVDPSVSDIVEKQGKHIVHYNDPYAEITTLQYLEKINQNLIKLDYGVRSNTSINNAVTIIGAGIVNLITALYLLQKGYQIHIYDAGPEPYNEENWKKYGCSFGGADARIFSFNESRHHHYCNNNLLDNKRDPYTKYISDGGWLSCPIEDLTAEDWNWIEQYENYPQWIMQIINNDLIKFNIESYKKWGDMKRDLPDLFNDTGFVNRLFRTYPSKDAYQNGITAEQSIGAFERILNTGDINDYLPCWGSEYSNFGIEGIIEVKGFGINIHKLMNKLITHLTESGVTFHWNEKIKGILYDVSGKVKALQSEQKKIESDFYVISPGVPIHEKLLSGTLTNQRIGAMIGCWITLPNVDPVLDFPIKVSRNGFASKGAAAGANVIPAKTINGENVIHISAGHGFLGTNKKNLNHKHIVELAQAVHETATNLFPKAYKQAQLIGWLDKPVRYCIRPWTPSCLGIFEMIPTSKEGILVVTGGHNTGGFAQSPVIAEAVVDAFEGRKNSMHNLYHPTRLDGLFKKNNHLTTSNQT